MIIRARLYRPAPQTVAGDTRDLNDVRPQYRTSDGWVIPRVPVHKLTPTGARVIAHGKYAIARDALAERYGAVEIIHDELIALDKYTTECWPSCRGAFRKNWWECGCPCGGTSHASFNWLMNYNVVKTEPLTSWLKGYRARRTTFAYVFSEAKSEVAKP